MMISKDFAFVAGHALDGLPDEHPCSRVHGHNYRVRVKVAGPVTAPGFVIDYGDLSWFAALLADEYDHRWLGAGEVTRAGVTVKPVVGFNPTAEYLALHFADLISAHPSIADLQPGLIVTAGVSETPKTWAWSR